MVELLLSPAVLYALFGLTLLSAAAGAFGRRGRMLWAALAGICAVAAVLVALLQGNRLEDLLTGALALAAVCLAGLTRGERRDGDDL